MITLIYNDMSGLTLPEGKIEEFVYQFITEYQDKDIDLCYGQELILNYFRLAIRENKIPAESVVVKYNDTTVKINSRGRLEKWPMPDYLCDVLSKL